MLYFLASDIAGGITGPVDFRIDFGEWIDAKNIDVLITFVLGMLLGFYICHKIFQHNKRKKEKNNKSNEE